MDAHAPSLWWTAVPPAPCETPEAFRAQFPALERWTYLNTASVGVMSARAADRAKRVVEAISLGDFSKEEASPMLASARAGFGGLVGAAADQVGVVKNVSDGLNALATAVPGEGGNVVVCTAMEHPNNIYLWQKMAAAGVEIRDVPAEDGHIPAHAMAAAIDAETRIVTASSVTFTPGFRTDLATIGRAARERGAFFLVDAVQSCGVVEHDLEAEFIDGLVTSTTKNLLGSAGLGFVAVARPWIERLTPVYVSRYGVARGSGHESEIESAPFAFDPTASRFEVGNHNWPAIAAADVAIGEIAALGLGPIARHATELADALRDGLEAEGFAVNRPRDPALRTQMVTLGVRGAGTAYETDDRRLNTMAQALREAKVRFSIRRGLVRFGVHGFNDARDVETVLRVARDVA
ncbi:aminotransferase class V-fold PLP-dependent enzyme [Acuticoccus sp. I52.16.1]|uniref:aminotransferase class V-fold PLP-dependent enzyme n=1 Tax=Acuticoccus sp. I52.16.1 TaxID=2928472 RepID=UPI001FD1C5AB|nr:aminotransferase class V-fold PLP-dependent enzyme [Acuticoccus sp. I52.16.1]UOM37157.1 aminotransferase class V-fold PLP-dependent enzyme [Acuticoccus sp. I52.16.1]